MNNCKKTVLANCIRLLISPLEQSETATILIMFATGSRYETPEINGISHFLEHMFFKGTLKRPTAHDISKELDGLGAEFNAFTSKDFTGYYIKVAHQHLPVAIDVVSDMLLNSKFEEEELAKEKGAIVEEINMYEDNPLMYMDDVFEQEMFQGSSLGWLISGGRDVVKAITREQMVNYKNHHYIGERTVIGVSGKISPDIESQIEQAFSSLPKKMDGSVHEFAPFQATQAKPRLRLVYRDVQQAQIGYGFPALPYKHKDELALKLLAVILGGNMSSRLFIEVRERRGLAYMVRANIGQYQDIGNFMIQAGLDKERIKQALQVIKEELQKVKDQGVDEGELQRAKDFLKGKISIDLEDTSSLVQWYVQRELLTGETFTPAQRFAKIDQVTAADIKAVANDIFDFNKTTLAIIGPFKDDKFFSDCL